MFKVHSQHLDIASGFHVIELRNEHGARHLVQIAVGHDACPACGHVHPKNNLGEIDPKAAVQEVVENLNRSAAGVSEYARKHGLKIGVRDQGPGIK